MQGSQREDPEAGGEIWVQSAENGMWFSGENERSLERDRERKRSRELRKDSGGGGVEEGEQGCRERGDELTGGEGSGEEMGCRERERRDTSDG